MPFIRWSATSSGQLSATSQVTTIGAYLCGFELNPPATGLATLKIYDSNAAGTTKLLSTATTAAGLASIYCEFPAPRTANSGIYAVLTGTTTYAVGFSLG